MVRQRSLPFDMPEGSWVSIDKEAEAMLAAYFQRNPPTEASTQVAQSKVVETLMGEILKRVLQREVAGKTRPLVCAGTCILENCGCRIRIWRRSAPWSESASKPDARVQLGYRNSEDAEKKDSRGSHASIAGGRNSIK